MRVIRLLFVVVGLSFVVVGLAFVVVGLSFVVVGLSFVVRSLLLVCHSLSFVCRSSSSTSVVFRLLCLSSIIRCPQRLSSRAGGQRWTGTEKDENKPRFSSWLVFMTHLTGPSIAELPPTSHSPSPLITPSSANGQAAHIPF